MSGFDRIIDRRGTASLKWDFSRRLTGQDGLLPLWVADMDFPAPEQVIEAVRRRAEHGIYGYALEPDSYFEAAMDWLRRRHGWRIEREWIIAAPGVVPSINVAIQAFTAPGERVVIQPPVYYPFARSIRDNGREPSENPLRAEGLRYAMDYEQLERSFDPRARLLILCSPHNPVGRVWSPGELERLGEACLKHDLVLLSDEIHHDLVLPGFRHTVTATLSEELARRTVTCVSATKTFNLAGLGGSLVVISDPGLRRRFEAATKAVWTGLANAFAVAAAEAAWRHGEGWLERLLAYIRDNYVFLIQFLQERLSSVKPAPLEGTYLAWLDFRGLGLSAGELRERLLKKAHVWLDEGTLFGAGGEGFQRVNLACPRATLQEALERIAGALG